MVSLFINVDEYDKMLILLEALEEKIIQTSLLFPYINVISVPEIKFQLSRKNANRYKVVGLLDAAIDYALAVLNVHHVDCKIRKNKIGEILPSDKTLEIIKVLTIDTTELLRSMREILLPIDVVY